MEERKKERWKLEMREKKKEAKRGEEKKRKKRTKRELLKEDVTFLFLWRLFESFSQRGDLESCGDLSWEDLLDKPEDLSDRESEARVFVSAVLDVTDVPVSPSSVVTEFCDSFSCCTELAFVEPQSFFSKKACSLLYSYAGRNEVLKDHK